MSQSVFTSATFDLLAAIARTPTAAFYLERKPLFQELVERPLQGLLRRVAVRLPGMMRDRLETQRNIFSRFLKNDFGRGGAWANYWGAFYPKGSRRIADVQLAVWMNAERVGISFYIGEYGPAPRERFLRNVRQHRRALPRLLGGLLADPRVLLSHGGEEVLDGAGRLIPVHPVTWTEWLDDPAAADFYARDALTPRQAVTLPGEALEDLVVALHAAYFPLALLAMEENPLPLMEAYAENIFPEGYN